MGRVRGIHDHVDRCPIPLSGGGDCWADPHPASRHGLCIQHWREILHDWAVDNPEVQQACPLCDSLNRFDPVDTETATCWRCSALLSSPDTIALGSALDAAEQEIAEKRRGPLVYYAQFNDRVKIGFTTNLARRMTAIPHDRILATEPGDIALEHARHRQFAQHRVAGHLEWFNAVPEILEHAAAMRELHGAPHTEA